MISTGELIESNNKKGMIVDQYNRIHDYLRISLTDNCNLRCFYCMPEENYDFTPTAKLMQVDEIESLAKIFVSLGVRKIRLTGGEPLVRKDADRIIMSLSKLPVRLTMTTNGSRLHQFVDILEAANIRLLNISLDTLSPEKFQLLTRRDQFKSVYDNIQLLLKRNFHVKVNMVVMKGLNEAEINDFVEWTKNEPVHVRFIEFMPFTGNRWTSNKVFTMRQMLDVIEAKYDIIRLGDDKHDTAKAYKVPGHQGTFAIISTMSANFCANCNRMRLTADGKMKNCLFSKEETDLLSALRNGEDVTSLIHKSILGKAKELGGQFTSNFKHLHVEDIHNRSMITIGG
jgi:cyclic pyranopterin phosphate synthase